MNATARRVVFGLAAPLLAIVFSLAVTSVVLRISGSSPVDTLQSMYDYSKGARVQVLIVNTAITYYFAALAVAIGFRMNLFNIGVDGQYRLAAMLAASLGGNLDLPAGLHVLVIVVTAMFVAAMWAGIVGLLRVKRGVNEVISSIMLNFIASAIIGYLLQPSRLAVSTQGSNNLGTKPIPASGQVPGFGWRGASSDIYGFLVVAVVVGFLFWFVTNRTRFGFDLKATGQSESAAVASGVDVKKMVVVTMLISGALAGLIGMPQLLGASYTYSLDFPAGIGFTGIAIALLGRNNPVGIAIGALLFGFLDNSSTILELEGVPTEIVQITQGVIVLSVVIAYELVRRYRIVAEQREVGRALGRDAPPSGPPAPTPTAAGAPV